MMDFDSIGFIGLGAMGSRMARNLVKAGYPVRGYDIRPAAIAALVAAGGSAGESATDVVRRSSVVLTSLVAHVYLEVAQTSLLPNARAGQVFIDHSTVAAPETRRLSAALAGKGAIALDVPVSGWITGAESGMLTMFVGGDEPTARRHWPLFELLGDPERIIYAGPAGMGQVMKAVQQMKNRLLDVARMEVIAFGLRAGLEWPQVLRVLDVAPEGEDGYARLYRRIAAGEADQVNCMFGEWTYYLAEAEAQNMPMPILESICRFFSAGERVSQDEQSRSTPSLWHELMTREGSALV